MGNAMRMNVNDFNLFRINQTFQKLAPVIFLRGGHFWHVMGMGIRCGTFTSSVRIVTS